MERNVIKLKVDNKDKDLATYLKPQWSWKTLATIGIFLFVLVFIVNDLEIEAIIGIFDWEREVKQLIKISYEVEVDIKKAFKSDNIEDTFDYKNTSKKIIKFVEKSSFQLIEALAENVSKIILQDEKVLNLRLSISKPGALRGSKEVGLKIFRSR